MKAWNEFVTATEKKFGSATSTKWLRSLKVVRFDACNLYLEAQDSFQQLWFEEHIRPQLSNFVNNNNTPIKVHLGIHQASNAPPPKKTKPKYPGNTHAPSFTLTFPEIDPLHIFQEFIITNDNLLAGKFLTELVATHSVATTPNPVFLYGPEGSGKTHLLQACAHAFRAQNLQVVYARAELFCDHVVRAIRQGEMPAFRQIYRKADVLIVDDIHIFAKKAATQEEFFHTFNTLHTAHKLIILSSRCPPQYLEAIEPRLISRFEWGISLPLAPLVKKEIIELIERRSNLMHLPLPKLSSEFIANTFSVNPKSAMKALQALVLRTHMNKEDKTTLTIPTIKTRIADLIEQEKTEALNPEKIIKACADHHGITTEDILGKSQNRANSTPRKLAMYLCRSLLKLPYIKIGTLFSRDHSTVMSAIRDIEKQVSDDTNEMRAIVTSIGHGLM